MQFALRHERLPTKSLLFNDVLYRIKVSEEILDPLRVFVTDKEFVKLYVKAMVGEQYIVPTIKILRSIAEVESYDFPSSCCIKPTHASGTIIIRRNNEPVDLEKIKAWFSVNHYQSGREANYKSLKAKVIVEPMVFDDFNVVDYKVFCYGGKPRLIQVDIDRHIDHTRKLCSEIVVYRRQPIAPQGVNGISKKNNNAKTLKNPEIRKLTHAIGKLSATELAAVEKALAKRRKTVETQIVEAEMAEAVKACPHCGCAHLKNAGSKGGRKRFRCLACSKTFNGFTGTPLAGLHTPDRFLANAKCMVEGMTVRKTAKALGLHVETAFYWRHRFLEALQAKQPAKLHGVVEADETFFLESFKGQRTPLPRPAKKRGKKAKLPGLSSEQIPVLVARDRASGATLTTVLPSRKGKDISAALTPRLAKDTVLMTDGATAYRAVGRAKAGVEVRAVKVRPDKRTFGPNHINNVNAYDRRLKAWMFHFNGVATKYLGNYLGWYRWIETDKGTGKARRFLAAAAKP